jgi:hypothetical protein
VDGAAGGVVVKRTNTIRSVTTTAIDMLNRYGKSAQRRARDREEAAKTDERSSFWSSVGYVIADLEARRAVEAALEAAAKARGWEWRAGSEDPSVQAPISFLGDYVVSHRALTTPPQHTVSFRPKGQHHHIATCETAAGAWDAADAAAAHRPRVQVTEAEMDAQERGIEAARLRDQRDYITGNLARKETP